MSQLAWSQVLSFWTTNSVPIRNFVLVLATVVGVPFVIWRMIAYERLSRAARQQAIAAQIQANIAEDGRITERFTKAIEQLGSDNVTVRLGGLYALERISQESPRDYWPIMEVLSAFVREHAPWPPTPDFVEEDVDVQKHLQLGSFKRSRVPADIDAIIKVIRRREQKNQKETQIIDLRRADLRELQFSFSDLGRITFSESNLRCADFDGSRLREATFWGCDLRRASFGDAKLQNAYFAKADLRGAFFMGADMKNVMFGDANVEGAKFGQFKLMGTGPTDLRGADLANVVGLVGDQLGNSIMDGTTKLPRAVVEGNSNSNTTP